MLAPHDLQLLTDGKNSSIPMSFDYSSSIPTRNNSVATLSTAFSNPDPRFPALAITYDSTPKPNRRSMISEELSYESDSDTASAFSSGPSEQELQRCSSYSQLSTPYNFGLSWTYPSWTIDPVFTTVGYATTTQQFHGIHENPSLMEPQENSSNGISNNGSEFTSTQEWIVPWPRGTIDPSLVSLSPYSTTTENLTSTSNVFDIVETIPCAGNMTKLRATLPQTSTSILKSSPPPVSLLTNPRQGSQLQQPTKENRSSVGRSDVKTRVLRRSIPCPYHLNQERPCNSKFQRPEHVTRHLNSSAHSTACPYVCPLSGCVDKNGVQIRFNRNDNYEAHVVNCHLTHSTRGRRQHINDQNTIKSLGWERFAPRVKKATQTRSKREWK